MHDLNDLCDLYDLALMLSGGSRMFCMVLDRLPGLNLRYADPA